MMKDGLMLPPVVRMGNWRAGILEIYISVKYVWYLI